jgi:hypothetical protein
MNTITCSACGHKWDGRNAPLCPKCISRQWQAASGLIRPKHHPGALPSGSANFRSVVTPEFVVRQEEFLDYAATSGVWYYSNSHSAYCHVTDTPLHEIPGSGIQAGDPMPDHALDYLVIAKADCDPHAFADDGSRIQGLIANGELQPLPHCIESGCLNLAVPNGTYCVLHGGASS